MAGQNGPVPARDEAGRLEQALARIARAAARRPPEVSAFPVAGPGRKHPLHTPGTRATNVVGGLDPAEIAARLDGLIADLRALLGSGDP